MFEGLVGRLPSGAERSGERSVASIVGGRAAMFVGAAAGVYVLVYLYFLRNVGPSLDEWEWLLFRMSSYQRWSSSALIVVPYNSQPIVGEMLLYRLWAYGIGPSHHWIVDLLFGFMEAGVALLVYSIARRRVGSWPAVACAVLVLVMGRAWETLLFPASMTFVLPTLAVCAAWATLDRPRALFTWVLVSVLLGFAAVSGGLGIAGGVGIGVEVALARRWRGLWLAACAAVPWIVWYIVEHATQGVYIAHNLRKTPLWGVRYVAAASAAAVGLPAWAGFAVLPAVTSGILLWRWRSRPLSSAWTPRGVGLLTTLVVAVVATGAARASDTPPATSRYMYFPAIVLILLVCEWTAGLTVVRRRLAGVLVIAVVVLAAVLGAQQFRDGKVYFLTSADASEARMGAMRLAGAPSLFIEANGLGYSPALLASFTRRFGSRPIYSEDQIASSLPSSRADVDKMLAKAEVKFGGSPRACHAAPADVDLPRTGATVVIASSRPRVAVLVRFADASDGIELPVFTPRTVLRVRADRITRPWRLLAPGSVVRICR